MTLNGVMAVTLRYFTEFGKHALQKTMCGGIYARVYCSGHFEVERVGTPFPLLKFPWNAWERRSPC